MTPFTEQEKRVLGLTAEHLVSHEECGSTFLLEPDTLSAFKKLKQASIEAGFNLSLVSAFRSFERQTQIWEGKLDGTRKVHDDQGNALDVSQMTTEEKVEAIIRFSAIPGLSRHHLGTDMDVFDASVMKKNEVQLEPAEVEAGGICAPMHVWLDEQIARDQAFGFYRPYTSASKTVAPERWHLSYRPKSVELLTFLSSGLVEKLWRVKKPKLERYLVTYNEKWYTYFCEQY